MATEVWRFQVFGTIIGDDGSAGNDLLLSAAAAGNGTFVLAGSTEGAPNGTYTGVSAMAAMKLDMYGDSLWTWQGGSKSATGVAVTEDGSIVLGGHRAVEGGFAAVMLDSDGGVVWQWENDDDGVPTTLAMSPDGSTVLAGYASGASGYADFAAYNLGVNGTLQWAWQNGTNDNDFVTAACAGEDGSFVLAGVSTGDWSGLNVGSNDFTAIKVDSEGGEIWRWQGGTPEDDAVSGVAISSDGSVLLAGTTYGDWSGANAGSRDFTAVKLDAEGNEIWRWQDGTSAYDDMKRVLIRDDDSTVLVGSTSGLWGDSSIGLNDFVLVSLDENGTELWRWQGGSSATDYARAIASQSSSSQILVAGQTLGEWAGDNAGENDFAAVWLDTNIFASTAPTPSQIQSPAPSISPSMAPTSFSGTTEDPTPSSSPSLAATPFVGTTRPSGGATTQAPTQSSDTPNSRSTPSPTSTADKDALNTKTIMAVSFGLLLLVVIISAVLLIRRQTRTRLVGSVADLGNVGNDGGGSETPSIAPPSHHVSPRRGNPAQTEEHSCSPPAKRKGTETQATSLTSFSVTSYAPDADERTSTSASHRLKDIKRYGYCGVSEKGGNESSSVSVQASSQGGEPQSPFGDAKNPHAMPWPSENKPAPSRGCRAPKSRVGVARAVIGAAHDLTKISQIPGVAEVAGLVVVLMNLAMDSCDIEEGFDYMTKRCRSILLLLQRAASILENVDSSNEQAHRDLIDDVRDAVGDLVEVITTYKSKGRIAQVMMSTLFKKRQDDAEAVIDGAIGRLQFGLNIQVGHKLDKVGQDVREGLDLQLEARQRSGADSTATSLLEARRMRRQRNLDKVEIPEQDVTITDELLGKGGFGAVYFADYNGRNAAAKVVRVEHDLGTLDVLTDKVARSMKMLEPKTIHENIRRKAFWQELQAMIRLNSPHTVHLYGAITSRQDRLVLVMELLPGGDLRGLLKDATEPLPEEHARRIISDICAGMSFLHKKDTIHGDLKSPNVLFDGAGRAKIGDFGTSKWPQLTDSTGLATYATRANHSTHMSLAWAAPEVLDAKGISYASDVYSFGVVLWEVFSRKLPWAEEACPRDIYVRVVFKEDRLAIPDNSPTDMARVMNACWVGEPTQRPTFSDIISWQSVE